jgi:hypothetical protein
MIHRRIVLSGFTALLALASSSAIGAEIAKAGNNLGEMREWLQQRNQERKALGLPGADMPKSHFPATHLRWHSNKHAPIPKQAHISPPSQTNPTDSPPATGTPVLHIGRGADGRIHVKYVLKEDGPDQVQVYSGAQEENDEAETLAKLTPRGQQAWMAGRTLKQRGLRHR